MANKKIYDDEIINATKLLFVFAVEHGKPELAGHLYEELREAMGAGEVVGWVLQLSKKGIIE